MSDEAQELSKEPTFKQFLRSVAKIFAWAVALIICAVLYMWWDHRSIGLGGSQWFVPLFVLSLLFVGALGTAAAVWRPWQQQQTPFTDAVQAISSVFSTLLVALGLVFAVAEFGQSSLAREQDLLEKSTQLSKEAATHRQSLYRFVQGFHASNKPDSDVDIPSLFQEDLEKLLAEHKRLNAELENCARFKTCQKSSARRDLCQLGLPVAVLDIRTVSSFDASALFDLIELRNLSVHQLTRHCTLPRVLAFGINQFRN